MIKQITPELVTEAIKTQDNALASQILSANKELNSLEGDEVIQLSYIRVNSLTARQFSEIIQAGLLPAYEIPDFDLYRTFKAYIEQYEYVPEAVDLCKKTLSILEQSNELLGKQPIQLRGKQVNGTIGNFVQDYLSNFPDAKDRDSFSVIKYLNSSDNARTLDQRGREVLKNILELYHYSGQISQMWDSLPDDITYEDLENNFTEEELNQALLGDLGELEDSENINDGLESIDSVQSAVSGYTPQASKPNIGLNLNQEEYARQAKLEEIQEKLAALKRRQKK